MARFDDNIPMESALSRATREFVDGDTKISGRSGESAAAFFPASPADKTPISGGLYRAAGEEGALQGTADGLNGHPDARQGVGSQSVPAEVVGSNADGDANDDGTADA